jgi:WD40 repeat protein
MAIGVLLGVTVAAPTAARSSTPAKVAFSSGGRVFTIAADGSQRHQLTGPSHPLSEYIGDSEPVFSPDRTMLAFVRFFRVSGDETRSQIYLSQSDGSGQQALTGPRRDVYAIDPRWSPDGEWLAFARFSYRHERFVSAILRKRGDGTERRTIAREVLGPLSKTLAYLTEPAWAPDGTHLAYTRTRLDRRAYFRPSLHLINRNGTGRRLLRQDAGTADFSPNGSKIAFSSIRDRNGSNCGSDECSYLGEIYVMNADGTHLRRLTHNKGSDTDPDWSADGHHLVFSSDRNYPHGRSPELYSIAPTGSCLTWLTNGSPASEAPDWEPDASASTDPGGCGATSRPPLVDLRPGVAARERHFHPLWLGQRFRSMLLSHVGRGGGVGFVYDDCAKFRPSDCGREVFLQEGWICSHTALAQAGRAKHLLARRGALEVLGQASGLTVYSGAAQTALRVGGHHGHGRIARRLAALRQLRGLRQASPSGELPDTRVPSDLLRDLRRADAARRRLGSAHAAAEDLGISRGALHARLRLMRALDRLDSFGRIDCPGHR